MDKVKIRPGDRVYRWWDAGTHSDIQPLTVVRVNRVTVTVDTDQGGRFRLSCDEIVGPYVWD